MTQEEFSSLALQWKQDTFYLSSSTKIEAHSSYQAIISAGVEALPFIFADLRKEPDHWFFALYKITGINPINPEDAGNIKIMTQTWLAWADENGY